MSRYRFSPRGVLIKPVLIRISNRRIKTDIANIAGLNLLFVVTHTKLNT